MAKKLLLSAISAVAVVAAGTAMAGIVGSKHDLTTGTVTGVNKFSGTQEVCVFCHTPHGADTGAPVPLWNRTLNTGGTYQTYDQLGTSTLDGKMTTGKAGSVSLACLSCHDGTLALDAVLNEPGSGTDNAGYSAGKWAAGGTVSTTSGKLGDGIVPVPVTLIGTDLRNDHPVGVQYGGGGYNTSTPTVAKGSTKDPDFQALSFNAATTRWYIDMNSTGTPDARDIILYTRPSTDFGGGAGVSEPSVECASCHDPHNAATAGPASVAFLRVSNAASAVCLACHDK